MLFSARLFSVTTTTDYKLSSTDVYPSLEIDLVKGIHKICIENSAIPGGTYIIKLIEACRGIEACIIF